MKIQVTKTIRDDELTEIHLLSSVHIVDSEDTTSAISSTINMGVDHRSYNKTKIPQATLSPIKDELSEEGVREYIEFLQAILSRMEEFKK